MSVNMSMQIQGPTDEDANNEAAFIAPVPMVGNVTGTLRRKVAKRTFPWLLRGAALNLVAPTLPVPAPVTLPETFPPVVDVETPPQVDEDLPSPPEAEAPPQVDEDEDVIPPAAKRPRLESFTDVAADDSDTTMVHVPDDDTVVVAVPVTPPMTDDDTTIATPPLAAEASVPKAANAKKPTRVTLCKWTRNEDAQLTAAVKIFGSSWVKVAARIPCRTNNQCRKRWVDNLALTAGDNQSGKWTATEDSHLAVAVKRFGNEWSAVAALVPGRTNIQCRQRWARGLDLENGGTGSGEQVMARKWTPKEDAKLADAAAKFGNQWTKVAEMVPGRTNAQCRQRWVNRVNPANGVKCRKWSETEDSMLAGAVGEFGNDWTAVASQIEGRTNIQCRQRWLHSLDHAGLGTKTGKWTKLEDAKLLQGVQTFGNNWAAVAATVSGRTNGQCCQRWLHSSVNPDAGEKCRRWTPFEDAKLLKAMKKFGNDWTAVAALVPDRTNVQCGKRWARAFDPDNSDKGPWTPEEDATLTEAVMKLGNNWPAVANLVPRRGNVQCRQRWLCSLLPDQVKWTPEEDTKLIEAVGECGDDWTAVAALVPDRTDVECGKRWARAFGSSNNEDKEALDTDNGEKEGQALWWTPEEDVELADAVNKFGHDWTKVAALIENDRTIDQYRQRWVRHLDPSKGKYYAVMEQVHAQQHYNRWD